MNRKLSSNLTEDNFEYLKNMGLVFWDENELFKYIVNNYRALYNEQTSVIIIKVFLKYFQKLNDEEKDKIFNDLKQFKFLTETGKFLESNKINLGSFSKYDFRYSQNPHYYEFSLSRNYYISGYDYNLFVEFFKTMNIIQDSEKDLISYNIKDIIMLPYFHEDYKQTLLANFNDVKQLKIEVLPFIHELKGQNEKMKHEYFFKYYNMKESISITNSKKKCVPNYLIWYYITQFNIILTRKGELKPLDQVFNDSLFNSILHKISFNQNVKQEKQLIDFLLDNFNFAHEDFSKLFYREDSTDYFGNLSSKITNKFYFDIKYSVKAF